MSVTISGVIADEDERPSLGDLERRLVMAMGLFPEDRLFVPLLPAERLPGGV